MSIFNVQGSVHEKLTVQLIPTSTLLQVTPHASDCMAWTRFANMQSIRGEEENLVHVGNINRMKTGLRKSSCNSNDHGCCFLQQVLLHKLFTQNDASKGRFPDCAKLGFFPKLIKCLRLFNVNRKVLHAKNPERKEA